MLEVNKKASKTRPHSNTISGGRPPNINISKARPTYVRRNSEGSPRIPLSVIISEPTPVEPTSENMFKVENKSESSDLNSSSNNDKNALVSACKQIRNRSRNSSATSSIINDIKENSTIQKVTSKIKSHCSMEDSDSLDNNSSVVVSLAGTSGIYLANGKRNQDFHSLFKSVPEEDSLIDDYGCALQKEILLQGRIYISENHICFNANIFGWVTNLVIAFADIIEIEKKSTAYFIPNAIQISTDNAKHFFASFLSRDVTYDLMVDIWRVARPDLAPLKKDKQIPVTEADSSELSDDESDSYYDSDTEDSIADDLRNFNSNKTASRDDENKSRRVAPTPIKNFKNKDPSRRRAMSEATRPNFQPGEAVKLSSSTENNSSSKSKVPSKLSTETKPSNVDARTQLYDKTECECGINGEHYPNVVFDQVYNGSLEKFYELLFKNDFMMKFLTENQKTTELNMGEWKKGEGKVELIRDYSYIKPLNGAIGPKSTKCFIKEEIFSQDTQKYVTALATTSTPDVPSGGSFTCKTRTCLTWAGKGKVRMLVTVLVDFVKSSWLKSTIEKASIDGQQTFYKDLDAAFQVYFKQHPEEFGSSKQDTRRRKRDKKSKPLVSKIPDQPNDSNQSKSAIHQILNSISNRAADGICSIVNVFSSPRASHLTIFCLIMMACVNIFIAQRMSVVEQQLLELSRVIPKHQHETIQFIPDDNQGGEELWNWLERLDKSGETEEKVRVVKEEDIVWDDGMKLTNLAKDRLDKHMSELSNMIKKAESSLEDITTVVQEQRRNKINVNKL